MEMIFGSILALVCLLFGTVLGATLNEHATVQPYARAADTDTGTDTPDTALEQATTYLTGDIQLHVVEIDGRHWISADPDLGEEFHKYLSGDVYRTIQEYDSDTDASDSE